MKTKIVTINSEDIRPEDFDEASKILQAGGLVAFPTETVYGLGANALDEQASKKIYEAKGRPSDNPLIVHISEVKDIEVLAKEIPDVAYKLAEVFWPGPLTMIFKKKDCVPYGTTGGLGTVAIRLPANQIARELIARSQVYIAAPSANISGKPSPTEAEHVINDLGGKIEMIIDGGKATLGLESTIVDLSDGQPMILRPGCITRKMLQNVIGDIDYDPAIMGKKPNKDLVPKAPGMKYRHYAPEGALTIYEGNTQLVIQAINQKSKEKYDEGRRVGIIATDETKEFYRYGTVMSIGSRKNEATIAAGLYRVLRDLDELRAEYIFTESFADNSLGQAIMNRLLKAAGYHVIKVDDISASEGI
ncbi:MAG: L-threonylcarbamoyladenylate synthase [Mobilitalea sp.]